MEPVGGDAPARPSSPLLYGLLLAALLALALWTAAATGKPWWACIVYVASPLFALWAVRWMTDRQEERQRRERDLRSRRHTNPHGAPHPPSHCCVVHFLHDTEVRTEDREAGTVTFTCPDCGYRATVRSVPPTSVRVDTPGQTDLEGV